jgi:hypothetical protein
MLKFTDPILAEWEKTVCNDTRVALRVFASDADAAMVLRVSLGLGIYQPVNVLLDFDRLRDMVRKELEQARELRAKYAELEAKYAATQKATGIAGNRNIELGRENAELKQLVADAIDELRKEIWDDRGDDGLALPIYKVLTNHARALGVKL